MRALLLSLVLLLLFLPRGADAEDTPAFLLVGGATVLASPGVPAALDAFLPDTNPRRPFTWPLPAGTIVALGLPDQDADARMVADLLHLDVDDLAGGYRIFAWHDGTRPLAIVMAADPAALLAARFEFDADAPAAMANPNMRSLDFQRPNEQAGIAVRRGTRTQWPRALLRAWHPADALQPSDAVTAGGARANRLWLDATSATPAAAQAQLADLRAQGIEPVVYETIAGQISAATVSTFAQAVIASLRPWQDVAGVRHFALVFDATRSSVRMEGAQAPDHEHMIARQVASALRAGGLEALTVVPRSHSDARAAADAPPPVLQDIPEALIAWSGPQDLSPAISRAAAVRRVRAAGGVPVVLLETWSAPFQGAGHEAYIPSLPRGRAVDLGDVLEGVIVVGRRGAEAPLASLWAPVEDVRFGAGFLSDLVPTAALPPHVLLARTAGAVRVAAGESLGLVPWLAPMAAELARVAGDAMSQDTAVVPLVPAPIHADGVLDERPWAFAHPLVKDVGGVDVLVLSDGTALRLGLVARRAVVGDRPFLLQLQLGTRGRTDLWHVAVTPEGIAIDTSDGGEHAVAVDAVHASSAFRADDRAFVAEITFDRFALGGEPHLARILEASITWGPEQLWPEHRGRGLLVIGR